MNAKQVLFMQLDACHSENTWFVSLINSITGLTEEQATWKPNEATNSISEIIHHLSSLLYKLNYINVKNPHFLFESQLTRYITNVQTCNTIFTKLKEDFIYGKQ
ncbi:hypothetical protein U9J35_03525 [Rossellomorea aquimaris]|nr:hypothetical protein [Rossellomorea aquimaris]WRP07250.1 hypothetical protein U9J35_03525 [Rossellomorea aquimaris]